jgi:hypothetical protein
MLHVRSPRVSSSPLSHTIHALGVRSWEGFSLGLLVGLLYLASSVVVWRILAGVVRYSSPRCWSSTVSSAPSWRSRSGRAPAGSGCALARANAAHLGAAISRTCARCQRRGLSAWLFCRCQCGRSPSASSRTSPVSRPSIRSDCSRIWRRHHRLRPHARLSDQPTFSTVSSAMQSRLKGSGRSRSRRHSNRCDVEHSSSAQMR